ncbi:MAG: hypothetical protein A2286_02895 [Gammaproteobacteria bacterium RIFOXYA12_FULL_61_12]|nr:MAG: hypothetical protein A2286_02895 [Gammaproteobacteria bacterium RIFOXYA12_FULL_61_12]OGT91379.1 MAG: hypothetical protein A2514_11700 [Gammaproteobacteria bacterium RIFOXYD12_FULL_61_37]
MIGEGHLQQVVEALCQNGPAVGIVPILLQGELPQEEPVSDYRRKGLKAFWDGIRAGVFGFDLRQEPFIPLNQPADFCLGEASNAYHVSHP